MANPFLPVVEAMNDTAARFVPANALRVLDWYDGMSDLVQGVSDMFRAHAAKLENEFHMDPAAAAYANGLAGVFDRFQGPVAAARDTFYRVHADDIERIRNPQPNQDKWDVSANRD